MKRLRGIADRLTFVSLLNEKEKIMKSKSPWIAINALKSQIRYWSLSWATKRLEKMGSKYAIYNVCGWYYIGINGDFNCKVS